MKKKEPTIDIVNVVVSAKLKSGIDLAKAVDRLSNVQYTSEGFPGTVLRLKNPKAAVLLFSSGKMICSGAKSEKEARNAVLKAIDELAEIQAVSKVKPKIKVVNVVASVDLKKTIDLEGSFHALPKAIYEPDQFPALLYKMEKPKVAFIIFVSGKMICAGARNQKQLNTAVYNLMNKLKHEKLLHAIND